MRLYFLIYKIILKGILLNFSLFFIYSLYKWFFDLENVIIKVYVISLLVFFIVFSVFVVVYMEII